jgi:glycosyltransferase involved in cell wall biosynthesis
MALQLSVIVPAHQGGSVLPRSLAALVESDFPRGDWELIVVDDASTDETGDLAARWADRVVRLDGGPRGPAYARNRGAEAAGGEWLVFVDADVAVHRDTLRRIAEAIRSDPGVDALFGAYDDAPPAPGFLSQYRNLLHRYTHLMSAGAGETFWAGCGAVRRSAFVEVGGFDEQRYPRPQIEDIELGYRLGDHGYRIAVHPEIQGAHLKRWTVLGSLRTDLLDRGIPWSVLLLERRRMARPAGLNLKPGERIKAVLVVLGAVLLLLAGAVGWGLAAVAGASLWLGVTVSNRPLYAWFARQRGVLFALRVVPLNLWYYLVSAISVAAGVWVHLRGGWRTPPRAKALRSSADPRPG